MTHKYEQTDANTYGTVRSEARAEPSRPGYGTIENIERGSLPANKKEMRSASGSDRCIQQLDGATDIASETD